MVHIKFSGLINTNERSLHFTIQKSINHSPFEIKTISYDSSTKEQKEEINDAEGQ